MNPNNPRFQNQGSQPVQPAAHNAQPPVGAPQPRPQPATQNQPYQQTGQQVNSQAVSNWSAANPSAFRPRRPSRAPLIAAVVLGVLFLFAAGFGVWAFMGRQDYKNNSDQKAAAAVESAKAEQKTELNAEFAEREKNPYKTFKGPSTYGSVSFKYPKTWSVYRVEGGSSDILTVYMNPGEVGDIKEKSNIVALVFEIRASSYSEESQEFSRDIEDGEIKARAYRPKLVPEVSGLRVTGQFSDNVNGTKVYLPIRDRTLVFTTQSSDFAKDFDKIMDSLEYNP